MGRRAPDVEDPPEVPVLPIMITMPQAAALAQVGVDRVREWLDEPGFPAIRGKRQVRIHRELYATWLAERAGGVA